MKYLLALDIDGTITDEFNKIPEAVIDFLDKSRNEGAVITFLTGRFYPYALAHLKDLPFPYYLACQNGAELYEMPSGKSLKNYYVSKDLIMVIDQMTQDEQEDFIVYGDSRLNYKTFYREGKFSKKMLSHIFSLESSSYHPFEKLESFTDLPARAFPCVKHFGTYDQTKPFYDKMLKLPLEVSLIRDPSSSHYYMNLITHSSASKGGVIANLFQLMGKSAPVIAAGNDLNDLSLLLKADYGIAVGDKSPQELKQAASIMCRDAWDLCHKIQEAKNILGI